MSITFTNRISVGSHDAGYTSTAFSPTSGPIGVGRSVDGISFNMYLRFLVDIPKDSLISNAYLRFNASLGTPDTAQFGIYIQPTVSGSLLLTSATGVNNATKSGPVEWDATSWVTNGNYDTPNIASLLQPLVSNVAWSPHSMNFFVENLGTINNRFKYVNTYESSTTLSPLLTIVYSPVFRHLDVEGGLLKEVSAGSGHYLTRHSSGGYLRKSGVETTGALILDNGIIKEKA